MCVTQLLVKPLLRYITNDCRTLIRIPHNQVVSDFLRLYNCHLKEHKTVVDELVENEPLKFHMVVESFFLFCLVYSIGALVVPDDRPGFSKFFVECCQETVKATAASNINEQSSRKQGFLLDNPIPGQVYQLFSLDLHRSWLCVTFLLQSGWGYAIGEVSSRLTLSLDEF